MSTSGREATSSRPDQRLALQGEVAQAIANEISVNITPQEQARLARPQTVSSEAQDLYLLGLHF